MIGIGRGFVTTMKHLLAPAITERYPYVKRQLPERSRSGLELVRDENGELLCTACSLCAKECPDNSILVESEKGPDGKGRVLTRYVIDYGTCMFCGLCVENCTFHALSMTRDFEHATPVRSDVDLVLFPRQGDPDRVPELPAPSDEPCGDDVAGAPDELGGEDQRS